MPDELAGVRILVPSSRAGRNVLADALRTKGAAVVVFPHLAVAPPSNQAALDDAVASAPRFAWLLFSGAPSVIHFFERPGASELEAGALTGRVAALGGGTVSALKARSIRPDFAPAGHRPDTVVEGLRLEPGAQVLLVREESAERNLPDALRRAGAEVTDVAGYRFAIRADEEARREAVGTRPDLLALQNPTAARILRRALDALGEPDALAGVPVAAVGPSTGEAAARYGFSPDHVAAGRLADLIRDLATFPFGP